MIGPRTLRRRGQSRPCEYDGECSRTEANCRKRHRSPRRPSGCDAGILNAWCAASPDHRYRYGQEGAGFATHPCRRSSNRLSGIRVLFGRCWRVAALQDAATGGDWLSEAITPSSSETDRSRPSDSSFSMRMRLALLIARRTVVSFDCSLSMSGSRAMTLSLLHVAGQGFASRKHPPSNRCGATCLCIDQFLPHWRRPYGSCRGLPVCSVSGQRRVIMRTKAPCLTSPGKADRLAGEAGGVQFIYMRLLKC